MQNARRKTALSAKSRLSISLVLFFAMLESPMTARADSTFTRVTAAPVATASGGSGGAWGDFNRDGYVDLFVSFSSGSKSVLYTNDGHGGFAVNTTAGVGNGTGGSWGSAWGDYDNDGNLDLIGSVYGSGNNYLLHNNGQGAFAPVTGDPVVASGATGNNAVWSDFDNDGFIDAFFPGSANLLFHNNGFGGFAKVANSGAALGGGGQGCAWGDYDNDGYPDLFVTRVNQPNLLYHNNGNGTFTRVVTGSFATDVSVSQGCSWGDYDNDGFLDLVVCNVGAKNFLYHNNGDGTFTKVTNSAVSSVVANSSGGAWADYDNDGYLDLFIAARGGVNLLFHNEGDGTFRQIKGVNPVNLSGTWIGGAWGDFNNDGFPDLFVGNNAGNNALYLNNGNSNNWITIQCLGRISNRAAIGAKVRIKAAIRGQSMWQMREISGGGGLACQNALRAQFGLGDAAQVEIVRVEWPSGIAQEMTNVAARQILVVKEPSRLTADYAPPGDDFVLTVNGGKGLVYSLESSADLATWTSAGTLTNQTGAVTSTNHVSGFGKNRFFRARE